MVAPAVEGIDLFKIAGRSISGWVPSLKTGTVVRQPFCSQLEERLLMWLEYHPLVANYARNDIGPQFAMKYWLPIPQHAPFAIGYTFEDKPHHYLEERSSGRHQWMRAFLTVFWQARHYLPRPGEDLHFRAGTASPRGSIGDHHRASSSVRAISEWNGGKKSTWQVGMMPNCKARGGEGG